jgi:hypothetical protein
MPTILLALSSALAQDAPTTLVDGIAVPTTLESPPVVHALPVDQGLRSARRAGLAEGGGNSFLSTRTSSWT